MAGVFGEVKATAIVTLDDMIARELSDAVEVIPSRLFWATLQHTPKNTGKTHYFSTDTKFVYEPFLADFGPLNLAMVYRYCKLVEAKMSDPVFADKKIVHFCSHDPAKRANAVFLISAYMVIVHRMTAEAAWEPFANCQPGFVPFRDATRGVCLYKCTVLDCLKGLECAIQLGWLDWRKFDVDAYEYYQEVEHGDLNWIIPDKFIAFAGPYPTSRDADGLPTCTPEDYVPIFQNAGVDLVVRLNTKQYDRRRFIDAGIKHVDLYFRDGGIPPSELIYNFLHIAEQDPGAIAVHCKAGLGRTGTLIGLYAMKHYRFPGRAFIGWNRVCRPGSILGPQQQFMVDMQQEMFEAGWMLKRPHAVLPILGERALSSQMERLKLHEEENYEDVGQGDYLVANKRQVKNGSITAPKLSGKEPAGWETTEMIQLARSETRDTLDKDRAMPTITGAIRRSLRGVFDRK